ncbi:MAG: hypothetical protein SFU27_14430 [Thermonemataceae bacterium]|nr:hypothetical protein [Thermonemataceae bacterium]
MKILFFIIFFMFACVAKSQDILTYFKDFPYKQPTTILRDMPNNRLLVDNKHHFLNVENISDMVYEQSFTYFEKANSEKVFAYRYYEHGGKDFESVYQTDFYALEKNKWISLPINKTINYKEFWADEQKEMPPVNYLEKIAIDIVLQTHKHKIIHVYLRKQPLTKEDALDNTLLDKYYKSFKYKQIHLKWNAEMGSFEIEKKF